MRQPDKHGCFDQRRRSIRAEPEYVFNHYVMHLINTQASPTAFLPIMTESWQHAARKHDASLQLYAAQMLAASRHLSQARSIADWEAVHAALLGTLFVDTIRTADKGVPWNILAGLAACRQLSFRQFEARLMSQSEFDALKARVALANATSFSSSRHSILGEAVKQLSGAPDFRTASFHATIILQSLRRKEDGFLIAKVLEAMETISRIPTIQFHYLPVGFIGCLDDNGALDSQTFERAFYFIEGHTSRGEITTLYKLALVTYNLPGVNEIAASLIR